MRNVETCRCTQKSVCVAVKSIIKQLQYDIYRVEVATEYPPMCVSVPRTGTTSFWFV